MINQTKKLAVLLLAGSIIILNSCMNKQNTPKAIDPVNMDLSVRPGDDFFKYANGGWMKNHPIPDEFSRYGAFEALGQLNEEQLKTLLAEAEAKTDAPKGSVAQQIADFYRSGMDTASINALGFQPIQKELDEIDALQSTDQLEAYVAMLQVKGTSPLFYFYADQDAKNSEMVIANLHQGGLGLSDRDYYLNDDERSLEIRTKYLEFVEQLLSLTKDENAAAHAQIIMKLETRLAKASNTRLQNRDPHATYNKFLVSDFSANAKNFHWNEYFNALGLNGLQEINVNQPGFFTELDVMKTEIPLDEWKVYLKWNVINDAAAYLSKDFEDANFAFYGTVLSGTTKQKERWKKVLSVISNGLGEAVGQLYVERYFPAEAKTKMNQLVDNLKVAWAEHIQNLDWMSDATKVKALEKLDAIRVKVGYPDVWKDYSSVNIGSSYYDNLQAVSLYSFNYEKSKIGKPVNREEWGMYPQTVNAYYSPTMNEIVFPAAILQEPFFYQHADDAVNYGAIGVVIGHEMSHGFDDQGREYDKNGNLVNWWTEEDAARFNAQVQVLVDQFNNFTMLDSLHVDGKLCLGENIADFGGLSISYTAMQKALNGKSQNPVDGFTPAQRFFLSYAQVWRQNIRDKELMKRLKEDVHSPGEARVNGALVNVPEFYEAFGIQEGDKLFVAPDKRAIVW